MRRIDIQRCIRAICLACFTFAMPTLVWGWTEKDSAARQTSAGQVPVEKLAEPLRGKVNFVLQKGQLFQKGKSEAFPCTPEVYRWFLDSPDAALFAWKKLGATKASIHKQPDGCFLGSDGMGGELRWQQICSGPRSRIWYAEGSGRMGPLLPTMTIRAVVLLTFQEVQGVDGRPGIKHRLELFAHHDTTPLFSRITGLTAEAAGKKAMEQMELFFSGMAWYTSEHVSWSKTTFAQWACTPECQCRLEPLVQVLSKQDAARSQSTVQQTGTQEKK